MGEKRREQEPEEKNRDKKTKEIQKKERIEKIKEHLIKEGLEKEDVELAVELADYIWEFDSLVFENSISVQLVHDECKHDRSRDAFYAYPTRGQKESYFVYITGMRKRLEKQKARFYFGGDGGISPKKDGRQGKQVSWQELALGIAAHEVRHRLQRKPGFKKIVDDKAKNSTKKQQAEYDAIVIEAMAINAFHAGKSIEEIAKIIKTEENEK